MTNEEIYKSLINKIKNVDNIDDFLSLLDWGRIADDLSPYFPENADTVYDKIEELFGSVEKFKNHFDDLK